MLHCLPTAIVGLLEQTEDSHKPFNINKYRHKQDIHP